MGPFHTLVRFQSPEAIGTGITGALADEHGAFVGG
jgi:hypothetical protein